MDVVRRLTKPALTEERFADSAKFDLNAELSGSMRLDDLRERRWPSSQELNELPAGHVFIEAELAGQIGDMAASGDAVAPAIMAGDGGPAGGRLEKSQQQPQGRRFP